MYFVQLRIAPQNPKTPNLIYLNNLRKKIVFISRFNFII